MPVLLSQFQKHYQRLKNAMAGGSYVPPSNALPPPPPFPSKPRLHIPMPPVKPPKSSPPPYVPPLQSAVVNSGQNLPTFNCVSGIMYPITGLVQAQSGTWRTPTGFTSPFGPIQRINPTVPSEPFELDQPDVSLFQQRIPQAMLSQYTVNGKNIMLKQSDYKAAGGEGVVYVKGGTAYKIYHDPKKMIPVGKIQELGALKGLSNILGPQDVIYMGNTPVGFTMPAISDAEFLCKLFTKGFRDKNNITPDMINGLVKDMQTMLGHIHTKDILVVDYNEMNFLTNKNFTDVYHIDVDSWQTPSYPATAIMESIRDRKVKNRKFSKESDWFSFACVAFQMYIGTHPYKGRHPDFSPKDWLEMMNQNISVFNRKCKLPPATQPLDVIPKGHLKWFEAVFEKGERTAPPEPDQVHIVAGPVQAKIISGNDKFNVDLLKKYDSLIQAIRYIDGIRYVITQGAIYGDNKEFITFSPQTGYSSSRTVKDLVPVHGDKPIVVEHNRLEGKLYFKTFEGKDVGNIESNRRCFVANRSVYTVVNSGLIEVSFRNSGVKITPMQQNVANIFHNHQIFDGMVVQNMLGTCRFSIPYESGKCETVRIAELDKARIVDGKYDSGIAIVMAEEAGVYNRYTFIFSKDCKTYTCRIDKDVDLEDINFAIKDNGVCIAAHGDNLEIFADNSKVKMVSSPLNNNEPLIIYKNDTMLVNRDAIYKISSK